MSGTENHQLKGHLVEIMCSFKHLRNSASESQSDIDSLSDGGFSNCLSDGGTSNCYIVISDDFEFPRNITANDTTAHSREAAPWQCVQIVNGLGSGQDIDKLYPYIRSTTF
uniref:Uncharacterized protein n=1 Tax=Magallana gigas TaxID=29159 RepID=K1RLD6_MAGGI